MNDLKKLNYFSSLKIFIHITVWLIILQLQFDLFGLYESLIELMEENAFIDEAFILIPSLILLFYWNSHYLIPTYLSRKYWWKYPLILIISFIFIFHLGYFVFEALYDSGFDSGLDEPIQFYDLSLVLHLLVVGISSSLGISQIAIKKEKQTEYAEQMQKEAELKYLNAQINPHFIYNTLNGLYSQAMEENAEKTTELILQLSELIRYPLNNVSKERIPLTEELIFIDNFIKLQQLRLGNDYPINLHKKGNFSNIKVIPFLLIPIVENAFKYGISQTNKTPIHFDLEVHNATLIFSSKNTKIISKKVKSHSFGINNLKDRLNLIYKKDFTLSIHETNQNYDIVLKLLMNSKSLE